MATKRRKLTPTQKGYEKQLKRIKAFIQKASKRGYQFSADVIPKRPKRITKASVTRLSKITPEKLYKKAIYTGTLTDYPVSGVEGRKLEIQESQRKRKETIAKKKRDELPHDGDIAYDNIFNEFIKKLSSPTPTRTYRGSLKSPKLFEISDTAKTSLYSLSMSIITEIGEREFGNRLLKNYSIISGCVDTILYDSDGTKISNCLYLCAKAISDDAITLTEMSDIIDEQDYAEDWSEMV